MKKAVVIIAVILLTGIVGYQNKTVLAKQADKLLYQSPCDTPLPYRIGTIDSRFTLTQDQLLADIEQAGNTWNRAIGKTLFVYDPDAKMTINLVYDERQTLTTQLHSLDSELKNQKNDLQTQETSLDSKIADYQRKSADFKNRLTQFNQKVEDVNSKGGASPEDYQQLKNEQAQFQREADDLNALAKSLNQSTDAYNSELHNLNQTVDTYNNKVDTYTDISNYKPEQGLSSSDSSGQKIIVYFYASQIELLHTLSHEMGHALGLQHVSNPQSIMFSRTNNITYATQSDIAQLTEICRKKSIVETTTTKVSNLIHQIEEGLSDYLHNYNSS
jgi:DNA repair exonuclease SbcCD ATPase subunit